MLSALLLVGARGRRRQGGVRCQYCCGYSGCRSA